MKTKRNRCEHLFHPFPREELRSSSAEVILINWIRLERRNTRTRLLQTQEIGKTPERGPTYEATFGENLETFRKGLALRVSRRKTLLAGPYVGEFGHEIMDFQGYVRWFRRKYLDVHVLTFPGRAPLYRGCIVHAHNYDLTSAGYFYGKLSNQELRSKAVEFAASLGIKDYDIFNPMHLRTRWHRRLLFRQEHKVLGPAAPVNPTQKILFHFRNIQKVGPDITRNIRPELAAELCDLCRKNNIETACIGHPEYSLCPAGSEDWRTAELEKTLAAIASSRLVVGELSGPMHLAVYAAKPVVIWAPGKHRIDYALKRNPFKVGISVVRDDTTNPSADEILAKVRQSLG